MMVDASAFGVAECGLRAAAAPPAQLDWCPLRHYALFHHPDAEHASPPPSGRGYLAVPRSPHMVVALRPDGRNGGRNRLLSFLFISTKIKIILTHRYRPDF
jgi:hypothetical protein